jgi:hypothetical protein
MGWHFRLGLVFVLLGFLAACASSAEEGKTTQVIRYSPTAVAGEGRNGECSGGSVTAPRDDAWRCLEGNRIFDPCFGQTGEMAVVCGASPGRDEKGFTLALHEPLPPPFPRNNVPEGRAWQLRLADGTVCAFAGGAKPVVDGKRLNYLCDDRSSCEDGSTQWLGCWVTLSPARCGPPRR